MLAQAHKSFGNASPFRTTPSLRRNAVKIVPFATTASIAQYPDVDYCKSVLAAFPAKVKCSPEEARVLYSADYAFLDVRSHEELDTEGKVLPKMPNVHNVPLVNFAKRYDSSKGRKVVEKTPNPKFTADVQKAVSNKDKGLILVCSGVPSQGPELRSEKAMKELSAAGYKNLTVLDGGYPAWAVKWTNKLERRVVGFVIASGGTSIEQSTGVSSKGSGVSGKDANSLMTELLMNYEDGGLYSDA